MTQIERGTDLHVRRQIDQLCPFVLDRALADTTIVNTAAETTLYSRAVDHEDLTGSVPRVLRLTLGGTYLNNTGGTDLPAFRVKLGATTMYDDNGALILSLAAGATSRAWRATLILTARSTTAQRLSGDIWFSNPSSAPTGTGGRIALTQAQVFHGTAAESTAGTGSKALAVTWAHGAASPNLSITLTTAVLERL